MKLLRFSLLAALLGSPAFAQTNTFPSSGNVGIGTSAPAAKLHIFQPGEVQLRLQNDNRQWALLSNEYWGGNGFSIYDVTADISRLQIAPNGNVGIGTTAPGTKLEVNGSFRSTYNGPLPNFGTGLEVFFQPSPELGVVQAVDRTAGVLKDLRVGSATYFSSNGNVGVGTTSPGAKLTIQSDAVYDSEVGALRLETATDTNKRLYLGYDKNLNAGYIQAQQAGTNWRALLLNPNGGNVGIGTANPRECLDVFRSGSGYGWYGRGVFGNENAVALLGVYHDAAVVGAHNGALNAWSKLYINTDPDLSAGGDVIIRNNVGIGTTNPTHKLAVNGTIKAKEVIVETAGWSDYVFADDYQLAPLSAVEAHIKEHKHLPGIPSAAQVAENGANVGEVQAALLAKVEELTLHLIAQQKQIAVQQETLQGLQRENTELQSRLRQLETK